MQQNDSSVVERLTDVLEILATHPGDARQRLGAAYHTLVPLQPADFPPEHRRDWERVLSGMTKFGPLTNEYSGEIWRSAVDHTMSRIRKTTAAEIAKTIYKVYWAMSSNQLYR